MMGRLIVLDGLDGCGKSTQSEQVYRALTEAGERVKLISFPDYQEPSSVLVRMYLNGEFSDNPDDVNAYAAGSFYAVDRYASYKRFWQKEYEDGVLILATRYTTSNAIHQMGKLPEEEWENYLQWLADFEYGKLGLPCPDLVIFLDMERAVSDRLLNQRYGGDESKKDIHERSRAYLESCRRTAHFTAERQDWQVIRCDDGENPLPIETITRRILAVIQEKALCEK
jgi:dTMP kinase